MNVPGQHALAHQTGRPGAARADQPGSAELENAKAIRRQIDLYRTVGRELEAADVPVEQQRRDGRVTAKADAGKRSRMDHPLNLGGEASARRRIRCRRAELDVFRPVKGLHWAVQARSHCIAEHELSDVDGAVGRGAVPEF
jgi:hypothetical protein